MNMSMFMLIIAASAPHLTLQKSIATLKCELLSLLAKFVNAIYWF
jgi:hypothetical protein